MGEKKGTDEGRRPQGPEGRMTKVTGRIFICFGGPVVRLSVNGRDHTFEMHRFWGPMRLRSDGFTPTKNQWSENSAFWLVFQQWFDSGQRIDEFDRGILA